MLCASAILVNIYDECVPQGSVLNSLPSHVFLKYSPKESESCGECSFTFGGGLTALKGVLKVFPDILEEEIPSAEE